MIARGGCYIGVTPPLLVETKTEERATAIRDGITQAGGDPTKLASVQVYDGNTLSAWINDHPAVALWVIGQRTAAVGEGLINGREILEVGVGNRIVGQWPQALGRLQLG